MSPRERASNAYIPAVDEALGHRPDTVRAGYQAVVPALVVPLRTVADGGGTVSA